MEQQYHSQAETWGCYKDGRLGGYIEAERSDFRCNGWHPQTATLKVVSKREFWGYANTGTAINLVLKELFDSGVELAMFKLFRRNKAIREIVSRVGFTDVGSIETEQTQGGSPVDVHLYLMTRSEWQRKDQEAAKCT